MNERLKFSWSHIVTFVAMIAVCYISFVGTTYMTNGDFMRALTVMGVLLVVLLVVFVGVQQLKASGYRMQRKIIWERGLLIVSPLIFLGAMVPMSHFWTVHARNDSVVSNFTNAISSGNRMFDDYEAYCNRRIQAYSEALDAVIANETADPRNFAAAGFTHGLAQEQKANMVEVLRLQLLSPNYDKLKAEATKWIANANQGASTWNVFLLGNTRDIRQAVTDWQDQLKQYTLRPMTNEAVVGEVETFDSDSAGSVHSGIDALTDDMTQRHAPNMAAIIYAVVVYLMLLFPYMLQDRHTKSPYVHVFKKRTGAGSDAFASVTNNVNSDSGRAQATPGSFRL